MGLWIWQTVVGGTVGYMIWYVLSSLHDIKKEIAKLREETAKLHEGINTFRGELDAFIGDQESRALLDRTDEFDGIDELDGIDD